MSKEKKFQLKFLPFPLPKWLFSPTTWGHISIIPVWGSLWRNPKLGLLKILIWGSVSVFVRWIIWHRAEESNWIIMSQILSFLTHLTSLPVGSISSSHSKISAICWCYFLVWVLIPIDGAAIDGDMLSIVLYLRRTFLARLFNHICIHFRDDIAFIPLLVPNFSSYKEWEYDL